jgi:hypothetical protein
VGRTTPIGIRLTLGRPPKVRAAIGAADIRRIEFRVGHPTSLAGLSPAGNQSWDFSLIPPTARYFSAGPSDSISRWTPCPPKYSKRWLQVGLGRIQLSPSCPFRPLHTFHFLRPARLRTPLLGYGAPHLSARGTSTLLNNALLSAHFRLADHASVVTPRWHLTNAHYLTRRGHTHHKVVECQPQRCALCKTPVTETNSLSD